MALIKEVHAQSRHQSSFSILDSDDSDDSDDTSESSDAPRAFTSAWLTLLQAETLVCAVSCCMTALCGLCSQSMRLCIVVIQIVSVCCADPY